jgi:acyl-CoA reductase-like NAD-dependent aldehyde dehydrogenase
MALNMELPIPLIDESQTSGTNPASVNRDAERKAFPATWAAASVTRVMACQEMTCTALARLLPVEETRVDRMPEGRVSHFDSRGKHNRDTAGVIIGARPVVVR